MLSMANPADDGNLSLGSYEDYYRDLPPQVIFMNDKGASSRGGTQDGTTSVNSINSRPIVTGNCQADEPARALRRDQKSEYHIPEYLADTLNILNTTSEGHTRSSQTKSPVEGANHIQVAIRIRPLIGKGRSTKWSIEQSVEDKHTVIRLQQQSSPQRCTLGKDVFAVDSVLDTSSENYDVYDKIGRPVVDAVANGKNGTFFAYGQTGSGKTFTMQGSNAENKHRKSCAGVIQIAAGELFEAIRRDSRIRSFTITAQYFEIYNEKIRDLLAAPETECYGSRRSFLRQSSMSSTAPTIRSSSTHSDASEVSWNSSSTTISLERQLSREEVGGVDDVVTLLEKGNRYRACGATKRNSSSSRSHAIFRLRVESLVANAEGLPTRQISTLNLVDLAGSENSKSAGATGLRKREGGKINQSLLSLSRVIRALGEPAGKQPKHIGYRDSKLTHILKPHLEGNAYLAVLCCISKEGGHLEETRSTLQFADRAKRIRMRPVVNQVVDQKNLLTSVRSDLANVRRELVSAREALASLKQLYDDAIQRPQVTRVRLDSICVGDYVDNDEDSMSLHVCGGDERREGFGESLSRLDLGEGQQRLEESGYPKTIFLPEKSEISLSKRSLSTEDTSTQEADYLRGKIQTSERLARSFYNQILVLQEENKVLAQRIKLGEGQKLFDVSKLFSLPKKQLVFLKHVVMFGVAARMLGQHHIFYATVFFLWLCGVLHMEH